MTGQECPNYEELTINQFTRQYKTISTQAEVEVCNGIQLQVLIVTVDPIHETLPGISLCHRTPDKRDDLDKIAGKSHSYLQLPDREYST